uniref:SOCS box domain-containing protein n=1 Tax=Panagrolaimus superbus TaxID=310955 RepID=A0A914ZBN2_9BILA
MYFITPSNPNIFLIGIFENRLFGFGEEKKKLCIFQKSIFDIGNWEKFFVINATVMKSECCETGLQVASNIHETKIWIVARVNQFACVYSVDISTKQFIAFKMLPKIYHEGEVLETNLCCKCLMPIIRYLGDILNINCFLITQRRCSFSTEKIEFRVLFAINESQHCLFWKNADNITFNSPPLSSNVAVTFYGQLLSVYEKSEDKRIKHFSIMKSPDTYIARIPDDTIWHEITFFSDHHDGMFALTRETLSDSVVLKLYLISISYPTVGISFRFFSSHTVDVNFPSLESAPFYFSCYSSRESSVVTLYPRFIVFQAPEGIVTIPLRMLSLSEFAYLSLSRMPKPPIIESKLSTFQRIIKYFRKKPNTEKYPWMSLNFIKKTLGLSKDFELK